MSHNTYLLLSILVLAVLLFFPTSRLIWTLSVRRMQRKLGRELDRREVQGQLQRARVVAIILVLLFSYLFNTQVLIGDFHG